jgi:hypothetical protein
MRDSSRKLVFMQWIVISMLIAGASVGGYMLIHKADDLSQTNDQLTSDNASLRRQLDEAQASASPSPTASPSPSASPSASPSTTPTPSPTASAKP